MSAPEWLNKRVLVTGASGELGVAIVSVLSRAGAKVTAATLRRDAPAAAARHVRMDITDEASVRHGFDEASADGPLEVLVHAAGAAFFGPLDQTPLSEWNRLCQANLTGTFLCAREKL